MEIETVYFQKFAIFSSCLNSKSETSIATLIKLIRCDYNGNSNNLKIFLNKTCRGP